MPIKNPYFIFYLKTGQKNINSYESLHFLIKAPLKNLLIFSKFSLCESKNLISNLFTEVFVNQNWRLDLASHPLQLQNLQNLSLFHVSFDLLWYNLNQILIISVKFTVILYWNQNILQFEQKNQDFFDSSRWKFNLIKLVSKLI